MDQNVMVKILDTKVARQAYADGLSGPLKEVSELVTYYIKTVQLMSFPFQVAAAWQDRLKKRLQSVVEQVPVENRIEPSISILVPIVSQLNYLEEENSLVKIYQNLLATAMDKTRKAEVHPGFITTISNLSPDEVLMLTELTANNFKFTRIADLDTRRRFHNHKIENNEFPISKLAFDENFDMYIEHLEKLDLICVVDKESQPIQDHTKWQVGIREIYTVGFTKFGDLFMKACLINKQS